MSAAMNAAKNEFLEAALQYCDLGLAVLPLVPRRKEPMFKNWPSIATSDKTIVDRWWHQEPNDNVGIATGPKSGVFVLDVDHRHGGNLTYDELISKHGRPKDTWQQITGTGGFHLFFRCPSFHVRNVAGLWPGIDIRGDGGYVVAPPSIHPDTGNRYSWDGLVPLPQQELSEAPEWLIEALYQRANPQQKPKYTCPAQIPHGVQHHTLVSLAGALRRMGLNFEEILPCVQTVNDLRCENPGPPENIRKIVSSMMRYNPADKHLYDVATRLWRLTRHFEFKAKEQCDGMQPVSGLDLFKSPSKGPASVIEGLLNHGLTIFAGRPKIGKSWFTMQLAIAVAYGTAMWGRREIDAPGKVAYFALEEGQSRTSARLQRLVNAANGADLARVEFLYRIPPLMGEGKQYLHNYLEQARPTVVIIDTLMALCGGGNQNQRRDIVRDDYQEIQTLQRIAAEHQAAMVVVHHLRKHFGGTDPIDEVMGTTGTTAAADCIWTLQKAENGATFKVKGREVEDQTLALRLELNQDPPGWWLIGEGETADMAGERQEIYDLLWEEGPQKPDPIAKKLGKNGASIRQLLRKMLKCDQLGKQSTGEYYVTKTAS